MRSFEDLNTYLRQDKATVGIAGGPGQTGFTGSSGLAGATGESGLSGLTGSSGPTGSTGVFRRLPLLQMSVRHHDLIMVRVRAAPACLLS